MLLLSFSDEGKKNVNAEWIILYFYLIGYFLGHLFAICMNKQSKHSKQNQNGK